MENKEIELKDNKEIENYFDLSIEETKQELQSLQLKIQENQKFLKVKKMVDVVLYPLTFVIDVVMMPMRMVKIVKNIDFVVSFVKDKQIAELYGMVMKNQMFPYEQYKKVLIDEFIHKNMKLDLMNEKIVKEYNLHGFLFDKEGK